MMKVVKFGGSSVSDARQISKIIDIVSSDNARKIIVISAPGKRDINDNKVTDLLINLGEAIISSNSYELEFDLVIQRFEEIQIQLNLSKDVFLNIKKDILNRIENKSDNNDEFMDSIKAAGEDNNAKIIAAAFNKRGLQAKYIHPGKAGMILSSEFGNAEILTKSYEKLSCLKNINELIIFPGFFGETEDGKVATFPRGGSDITGAILAAAVNADEYENFTDVDAVYAMDPRIIQNPPAIAEMTYREMRELAYAGFGVFHDEAIIPTINAKIPICVKNTNDPDSVGTKILPYRKINNRPVAGISSSAGFSAIYIDKYMMNRQIGFGRKLLQILENENISYEHSPSGIDNVSVILKSEQLSGKEDIIIDKISYELKPDAIKIEHNLSLLMVVGEGMCFSVGMAAQATKALAEANVNIEMINQGASEISMMFAVKDQDRKSALSSLGKVFL